MKTNREIISTVRSMLKSVNIDDRLPSAFIYSKIMDIATLIIKRESETRRIFNSGELFKKIETGAKQEDIIIGHNKKWKRNLLIEGTGILKEIKALN